jgi:hypothetical protein
VRVLGAGRVEQRSNGGCWAQGVCRWQSSNRAVRESSGGDFGGGVCARCLEGLRDLKRNEKRKKWNRKWSSVDRKLRTRSWSLTAPATLPHEEAVAALPCIQHTLDANRLTWSDVRLHPDRPFASFIHASPQQEPTWDLIIDTRRKCRKRLRLNSPDDCFPEAWTKRCNEYSIFKPGLVTTKRREGDEHTLRGLAGVYQFRINIIVVS